MKTIAGFFGFLGLLFLAWINAHGLSFIWDWHIAGWANLPTLPPLTLLAAELVYRFGFKGIPKTEDKDWEELAATVIGLTIVLWIFVGLAYLLK